MRVLKPTSTVTTPTPRGPHFLLFPLSGPSIFKPQLHLMMTRYCASILAHIWILSIHLKGQLVKLARDRKTLDWLLSHLVLWWFLGWSWVDNVTTALTFLVPNVGKHHMHTHTLHVTKGTWFFFPMLPTFLHYCGILWVQFTPWVLQNAAATKQHMSLMFWNQWQTLDDRSGSTTTGHWPVAS